MKRLMFFTGLFMISLIVISALAYQFSINFPIHISKIQGPKVSFQDIISNLPMITFVIYLFVGLLFLILGAILNDKDERIRIDSNENIRINSNERRERK